MQDELKTSCIPLGQKQRAAIKKLGAFAPPEWRYPLAGFCGDYRRLRALVGAFFFGVGSAKIEEKPQRRNSIST